MTEDAITLLTHDHREVQRLYAEVQSATPEQRRALVDSIVRELSVHDAIEKQMLYPTVRTRVEGGETLADRSLHEHQRVEELLARVEKAANDDEGASSDEGTLRALRETMDNVAEHVGEEEGQIFPALKAALSASELLELGDSLANAKNTAPTHPHPSSPNSGTGATVAGAAAGLMDKAKDAIKGRPAS